ncbi:uncharacterized protein ISCGN_027778 [Ixodes scapularis]
MSVRVSEGREDREGCEGSEGRGGCEGREGGEGREGHEGHEGAEIKPILTCPQDVVKTLPPGTSETWVTLPPPNTNLDSSLIKVSPFWVQKHGGSFPYGEVDVTYSVNVTEGGYSMSCTFTVVVIDKEPPKVEKCPDTVSALATTLDGVLVTWDEPEFSDNVEVSEVTNTLDSGTMFTIGVHTVHYTAIDESGNEATCKFQVNVTHKEPPKVEKCPDTVSALATTLDGVLVTWDEPEFSDNVEVSEVTNTLDSGTMFTIGVHTVHYTAMDLSENEATCKFQVNVTHMNECEERLLNCSHECKWGDSVRKYAVRNCGSRFDAVRYDELRLRPDPLMFPGSVFVNSAIKVFRNIEEPIKVEINMKKKVYLWVTVPCVNDFGSCDYENICTAGDCPLFYEVLGLPCGCPIKEGNYEVHDKEFVVPALTLPDWLTSGDYQVTVKAKSDGDHLFCVHFTLSIR